MNNICIVAFLIAGLQVRGNEAWKNGYDEKLYFTCPQDQSISMITSKHDNGAEDRVWDFQCKKSFYSTPACHWTTYVNNFDEKFTYSCPDHYIVSGMESYHSNGAEDRRWKFYCCRVNDNCNSHCFWTPYVNNFDEQFTWYVPHLNYLSGVGSYHHNGAEDRRWQYRYCTRSTC